MPCEALCRRVIANLVVQLRTADARRVEALAKFNALDSLQTHQCMSDSPVELAVPLHMTAQADRQPIRDYCDHSAERVPVLVADIDLCNDGTLSVGINDPHRRLLADTRKLFETDVGGHLRLHAADTGNIAQYGNAERCDQLPGE